MKDCIITKYMKSVNNPNALKVGEVKFKIKTNSSSVITLSKNDNDMKVYNSDGQLVYQADADSITCTFTSLPAGIYTVSFSDKYLIRSFSMRGLDSNLNIDTFKFSEFIPSGQRYFEPQCPGVYGSLSSILNLLNTGSLNRIQIPDTDIRGRLEELSGLTSAASITKVSFPRCKNIIGSLEALIPYTAMTSLSFADSGVSPITLKEFLDGQAAVRASGTLSIVMGVNDYMENNAGITRRDPTIVFSNGSWTWS